MGARARIGFLGPVGTFGEQALLTQLDLADLELVAMETMPEVLRAVESGQLDLGFVALENAIEGTVNATLDTLAFDVDLVMHDGSCVFSSVSQKTDSLHTACTA